MNAPEAHVQHVQPMIALAAIVVSKTNPRKTFDKAKLEELTGSVKLQGILQPILVRPIASGFEVVAGERRYKAAKAAGLLEIPATVRELTDAQALELQVIENNQREDLHPLEEAEGYESLMKCKHPDGVKYTVADIAKKVGKSTAYVYQKLKLCACCPEVRKAFYDGAIDFSKALLLARIHGDNLQRQALKEISTAKWAGQDPMNFRDAQRHVQQNYMLALDKAPFSTKDEKLVPKAGACTTCPKRTGNAPELFADVKSGDVCTDPPCFKLKRVAATELKKASAIADGQTVLVGNAAKQVKPREFGMNDDYVNAGDRCFDDPKQRTYAEIVGAAAKPILLENPHCDGELLPIFRRDDIKPIMKEKGALRQTQRNKSRRTSTTKAAASKPNLDEAYRKRLFLELCAKMPAELGKAELAIVAMDILDAGDDEPELVAEALLPPPKSGKHPKGYEAMRALEAVVPKLDAPALSRLVIALLIAREVSTGYSYVNGKKTSRMLDAAKRWKVDPTKVKKAIQAEAKAAVAAKKASAPTKKARGSVVITVKPGQKIKPMSTVSVTSKKAAVALDKLKRKIAPAGKKAKRPAPAFMKPMKPSEQLAVIVGAEPLARTEITSKVWAYIKKHDLQDKTNRRMINCNDALRPIMGSKKQVSMFEMTKFISKHIK